MTAYRIRRRPGAGFVGKQGDEPRCGPRWPVNDLDPFRFGVDGLSVTQTARKIGHDEERAQKSESESGASNARALLFGQFLIERGTIRETELAAALALMVTINTRIGEIAVRDGFITMEEADRINRQQRTVDNRWGELAVAAGILDDADLDTLLERQQAESLRLGELLVREGALPASDLSRLLEEHRSEIRASLCRMPVWITKSELAAKCLELFPKVLTRVAGVASRIGSAQPRAVARDTALSVTMGIVGPQSLQLGFLVPDDFARQVTAAILELGPEEVGQEDCVDGLSEVLNVLGGLAKTEISGSDEFSLQLPVEQAMPEPTELFEVSSSVGCGWFGLARESA